MSHETTAAAYLASDRVTVYSNHKMLGIRLVSRTRKYSEIGLSNNEKGDPSHQRRMKIYIGATHEVDKFIQLFRLRLDYLPLWHKKEAEKWEHDIPCCYFGEDWCQHLLRKKEPDYAKRTTSHSTVDNLAPSVIQQVNPEKERKQREGNNINLWLWHHGTYLCRSNWSLVSETIFKTLSLSMFKNSV